MRAFKLLFAPLLALFVAVGAIVMPAHADDTEIYLGANFGVSQVLPNIVFIIDTSGSMGSSVYTRPAYDPSNTYTGDCPSGRIYYSTNGSTPSCSWSSNYLNSSLNYCAASQTPLDTQGFYTADTVVYWTANRSQWNSLRRGSITGSTNYVECQADRGINGGPAPYDTTLYASNGSTGPWNNSQSNEIPWSSYRAVTLYSANYINYTTSTSLTYQGTRIGIVKTAFDNLLNATSNVNVAVMRYDGSSASRGGYFIVPMMPLNDTTRPIIENAVNNLSAGGNTPLAETEYEAYLYYQGQPPYFGTSTQPATDKDATTSVTYPDGTSATYDVLNSAQTSYVSPIQYQCQKNFTVLFTDGDPTSDGDADTRINALLSSANMPSCSFSNGNDCLDDLAGYMNRTDCRSDLSGIQNVTSYYIGGFDANGNTLLQSAATAGGGKYYGANDAVSVADAFNAILTQIKQVNTSFVSPAVAVNAFNRFTDMDQLYYGLFRPSVYPHWEGNLKRYRLYNGQIVDVNGNPAIDASTGFFSSDSTSWWTPASEAPDGDNVGTGGAASKITFPRNAYPYTGSTAPANVSLTASGNALSESNGAITAAMLGDSTLTSTEVGNILKWARGVDLYDINNNGQITDARTQWGDVLHSEPAVVTYGGTAANPDLTAFVGDNEGYLHAIDAATGAEYFAFMPQALLPNLPALYNDNPGVTHPYGMDGDVTAWEDDINGDGVIYDSNGNLESGEGMYVYEGMRRGGRNYYALNATDRSNPVLMWEIKGGTGNFAELGQTWSQPIHAKIKLNGIVKDVLFFGGGYDAATEDGSNTATNDTMGRAVYIVDAKTGARLWWAGPSGSGADLQLTDMTNSIPSTLGVFDVSGDGFADTIFVGDTRGQIWRFDIDNNNTGASNLAKGGVIAKLGGSTAADNRRFYYPPSVSVSRSGTYLDVAIGSGYRAHPLNQAIHDAFYVIHSPMSPPASYTALSPGNLYDTTSNVAASNSTDVGNLSANGWFINLQQPDGTWLGEKVLSAPLTFDYQVMFTTYTPVASDQSACAPSQGVAHGYTVDVANGAPIINGVATVGSGYASSRYTTFTQTGIVPGAVLIMTAPDPNHPQDSNCTILAGTNKWKDCHTSDTLSKTYWKTK